MPVYAEPQQLKNFKIEVIPANSNTPILVKQADTSIFTPVGNSSIVPSSRNSSLGQPSNLPPIQQNLRNEGQYRTVDLVPANRNDGSKYYSNAPLRNANNQLETIKANGGGLNTGQNYARDEAFAQLAYQSGFFLDGLFDGIQGRNYPNEKLRLKRDPIEDLSYTIGNKAGNQARNIVNDSQDSLKKVREDLWRNKPTFEIPKITLPHIEFPEFQFPAIPEFQFPEISFPQPQPVPIPQPKPKPPTGTLTDKIKQIQLTDCGSVIIGLARVRKRYEDKFEQLPDGGVRSIPNYVQSSIDSYLDAWRKYRPQSNMSDIAILESGGSTGQVINNDGYRSYPIVGQRINLDGSAGLYVQLQLPWYELEVIKIDITQNYRRPGDILNDFYGWEAYQLSVGTPNKNGCFIPLPDPNSDPPPPPPPDKDCCRMGCCPEPTKIDYRLIKRLMVESLKEQKFSVDVPLCTCELNEQKQEWEPKIEFTTLDFFATSKDQAEQMAQLHFDNAKLAAELCVSRNNTQEEAVVSLPLSWQIRNEGNRPQLVIQCAAKKDNNQWGSAMYPITVPHWKGGINDKPSLPVYRKGNHEGILVLADNSKVTVNAANRAECIKIINAVKPWIKKEMLQGSYFKSGDIDSDIKVQQVKPMYGRYFSTGQKKGKPDWRVDFP